MDDDDWPDVRPVSVPAREDSMDVIPLGDGRAPSPWPARAAWGIFAAPLLAAGFCGTTSAWALALVGAAVALGLAVTTRRDIGAGVALMSAAAVVLVWWWPAGIAAVAAVVAGWLAWWRWGR